MACPLHQKNQRTDAIRLFGPNGPHERREQDSCHAKYAELSSMGIRVNAETLKQQLEITGQLDFLKLPYYKAVINHEVPLSIGGGIGQSLPL
jgi:hypothetical protein